MTFAEYTQLVKTIDHHMELYYNEDTPEISDFEYDALLRRLEELEAAHPEYASPDSPTQHVGGYALNTFAQVHHQVPLESLQDVFSFDELRAFGARMDTALTQAHDYSVEPKIDGLSVSLEYRDGCFRPLCCDNRIWCNPIHRQALRQDRFQAFLLP